MLRIEPRKALWGVAILLLLVAASRTAARLEWYGEPPRVEQPPVGEPPRVEQPAVAAPPPAAPVHPLYSRKHPWERPDWTDFVRQGLDSIMLDSDPRTTPPPTKKAESVD